MNIEKIDFNATDGVQLVGLLHKPENKTDKVLIAVHGMTSNCFKYREDVIAQKMVENNIAFFVFNNRGSELMKYIKREKENGEIEGDLGGTSFEDVLDGYYDIKGAILKMLELGYKEIYLQGHSLGSTKVVYTYTMLNKNKEKEILDKIKGIILLSLVDISNMLELGLGKDKFIKMNKHAEELVQKEKQNELMPKDSFMHPISAKTFLRYSKYNKDIDFARYMDNDYSFSELNNIKCPLFMRWGDTNELIQIPAEELVCKMQNKITKEDKDISYIKGADHGYSEKEEELASEILKFLIKIN